MSVHDPEYDRVPFHVAVRLPPAWDAPEHRARIYGTFERLQVCLKCGNPRQAHHLMTSLKRLTDDAERRRQLLLGELDVTRLILMGEAEMTG